MHLKSYNAAGLWISVGRTVQWMWLYARSRSPRLSPLRWQRPRVANVKKRPLTWTNKRLKANRKAPHNPFDAHKSNPIFYCYFCFFPLQTKVRPKNITTYWEGNRNQSDVHTLDVLQSPPSADVSGKLLFMIFTIFLGRGVWLIFAALITIFTRPCSLSLLFSAFSNHITDYFKIISRMLRTLN